jgi:hypothetical protein
MTAKKPAATESETPGPKYTADSVCMAPATVEQCRADYEAGAELRRLFDATAKRQHRG